MKYTQFTPLTEQEMMQVNGGGILDSVPLVGPLLSPVLGIVQQLLASLGLPNLPV
jgi:bacteriocin-like protein